jgi:hypothetical protein
MGRVTALAVGRGLWGYGETAATAAEAAATFKLAAAGAGATEKMAVYIAVGWVMRVGIWNSGCLGLALAQKVVWVRPVD